MTDKTTTVPETHDNLQTRDDADDTAKKPQNKDTVRKAVLRIASKVRAGGDGIDGDDL